MGLSLLIIILIGCETNSTGIESEQKGTLTIYLTDATADYDSVNITFSEVSAHIDSDWVVVQGDPVTVDLLKWSNGKSMVLGSADVPAGKYTQIRIKIDDAEIGGWAMKGTLKFGRGGPFADVPSARIGAGTADPGADREVPQRRHSRRQGGGCPSHRQQPGGAPSCAQPR